MYIKSGIIIDQSFIRYLIYKARIRYEYDLSPNSIESRIRYYYLNFIARGKNMESMDTLGLLGLLGFMSKPSNVFMI